MWWSVRNGLSKRESRTDSKYVADQLAANVAATASSSTQTSSASGSSSQLNRMIKSISRDLHSIMDQEQQQVKVELANRARELCMKDINHDLRTPLNAIIGFAQLMESGKMGPIENPQYLEYLRHIRESGYDLLGKVEDLMSGMPEARPSSDTREKVAELEEAVA